jgi:hypothetical protein
MAQLAVINMVRRDERLCQLRVDVIPILLQSDDAVVVISSLSAIGEAPRQFEEIAALVVARTFDHRSEVRLSALNTVATLSVPRNKKRAIYERLKNDPDDQVRLAAQAHLSLDN